MEIDSLGENFWRVSSPRLRPDIPLNFRPPLRGLGEVLFLLFKDIPPAAARRGGFLLFRQKEPKPVRSGEAGPSDCPALLGCAGPARQLAGLGYADRLPRHGLEHASL